MKRPYKTYFGGKGGSGVYQKIINEIRPHDVFISAFLGNCFIMSEKEPAAINIGYDIDNQVVIDWYKSADGNINLLPHSYCDLTGHIKRLLEHFPRYHIVIYCDPPYLIESRRSKKEVYKHEFTYDDHVDFINWAKEMAKIPNIDILISHYPHELYDKELSAWRKISFPSQTRKGTSIENLYMNYDHIDGKLHQYDFVGDNKDERYNLRHSTVDRLIKKLQAMDARKKQTILHYLREGLDLIS